MVDIIFLLNRSFHLELPQQLDGRKPRHLLVDVSLEEFIEVSLHPFHPREDIIVVSVKLLPPLNYDLDPGTGHIIGRLQLLDF